MAARTTSRRCSDSDQDDEVTRLRREVTRLRKENARLSGCTQVLREGVLFRFREQMLARSWQARYVDLRAGGAAGGLALRVFDMNAKGKGGDGVHGDLRTTIQLSGAVEILREEEPSNPKLGEPMHCIQLKLPARAGPMKVFRIGADSAEEMEAWIDALESAIATESDEGGTVTRSVQQVQAGPPEPARTYEFSAIRPTHRTARSSVLTAEDDRGIPDCNVVGIINLCITVMVVIHIRLISDNLRKHGLVLDTFHILLNTTADMGHFQCIVVFFVGLPIFAAVTLGVEKLSCAWRLSGTLPTVAHSFNCLFTLVVPCAVIRSTRADPPVGITVLIFACTLFMKLVSYAHVNSAMRRAWRAKQEKQGDNMKPIDSFNPHQAEYPDNLTVRNMALFIAFPTLVYQTKYPRTERIRKRWLMKRVVELLVCLALMSIIGEQFVMPTLRNFALPVLSWNIGQMLVALLKIALPNVYLWLFMFYSLFHLWLNIVAELSYFGDRLFYKEWWNATNMEDYWRLWNLPVHNWLVKHIFLPLVNAGFSKNIAIFMTFFVSAVFHELLVSVPCHTFRLWAFFGMMAQLPLCKITLSLDKKMKGSQIGNQIFWISFCIVGQPLCVLLYFAQAQLGWGMQA